jgi:hypothetical protein
LGKGAAFSLDNSLALEMCAQMMFEAKRLNHEAKFEARNREYFDPEFYFGTISKHRFCESRFRRPLSRLSKKRSIQTTMNCPMLLHFNAFLLSPTIDQMISIGAAFGGLRCWALTHPQEMQSCVDTRQDPEVREALQWLHHDHPNGKQP